MSNLVRQNCVEPILCSRLFLHCFSGGFPVPSNVLRLPFPSQSHVVWALPSWVRLNLLDQRDLHSGNFLSFGSPTNVEKPVTSQSLRSFHLLILKCFYPFVHQIVGTHEVSPLHPVSEQHVLGRMAFGLFEEMFCGWRGVLFPLAGHVCVVHQWFERKSSHAILVYGLLLRYPDILLLCLLPSL